MDEKQKLWKKHAKEISHIVAIASTTETQEYLQLAEKAAEDLTPDEFNNLSLFFHKNVPDTPNDQMERFPGFSGSVDWMATVQRAIFAIYYARPEVSLSIVKKIAFGPYDWTQIIAIEVLCLWTSQNKIDKEQIIEEIAEAMPGFRYEALMPSISYVARVGYPHPKLIMQLEKFIDEYSEYDPVDVMHIINALALLDKELTRKHEQFLRDLMNGKGLEDRHPILDGAVITNNTEVSWGRGGPPPADTHQIRAATLLNFIFPSDAESFSKINDWQQNHPDQKVRDDLTRWLEQKSQQN